MAEHIEPVDPEYRRWATGSQLAEFHALTGAWREFFALIRSDPSVAPGILEWVIPEDDPDIQAYRRARSAAQVVMSKLNRT